MHLIVAGAPNPLMRGAGVSDLSRGFRYVWVSALTKSSKGALDLFLNPDSVELFLRQKSPALNEPHLLACASYGFSRVPLDHVR